MVGTRCRRHIPSLHPAVSRLHWVQAGAGHVHMSHEDDIKACRLERGGRCQRSSAVKRGRGRRCLLWSFSAHPIWAPLIHCITCWSMRHHSPGPAPCAGPPGCPARASRRPAEPTGARDRWWPTHSPARGRPAPQAAQRRSPAAGSPTARDHQILFQFRLDRRLSSASSWQMQSIVPRAASRFDTRLAMPALAGGSSCSSYADSVLSKLLTPEKVWSGALSGSQTLPGSRLVHIGWRFQYLQPAGSVVILELICAEPNFGAKHSPTAAEARWPWRRFPRMPARAPAAARG